MARLMKNWFYKPNTLRAPLTRSHQLWPTLALILSWLHQFAAIILLLSAFAQQLRIPIVETKGPIVRKLEAARGYKNKKLFAFLFIWTFITLSLLVSEVFQYSTRRLNKFNHAAYQIIKFFAWLPVLLVYRHHRINARRLYENDLRTFADGVYRDGSLNTITKNRYIRLAPLVEVAPARFPRHTHYIAIVLLILPFLISLWPDLIYWRRLHKHRNELKENRPIVKPVKPKIQVDAAKE